MGNCLFGGMGDGDQSVIRVTTSNGGVMEFYTPITVEFITDEFPGHGIFRSQDLFWKPLPHTELLIAGESYHLLPLLDMSNGRLTGHLRSTSAPQSAAAPYRMSFHSPGAGLANKLGSDVVSRAPCGFWKVKLVINPDQLMDILSQEEKTEELIESLRTVGKCGSVYGSGFSDQWSFSSSRNAAASNKINGLLLDL